MTAPTASRGETYRYLDHGFYVVSATTARRIAGGKLPREGCESLHPAPHDMPGQHGAWVWVSRTVHNGKVLWSVRDSGGWRMENGRRVLGGAL